MKFKINKNKLNSNYVVFLKSLGYVFIRDRRSQTESFARRIRSDFYPRFHVYVTENDKFVMFDIHIDYKRDASLSNSRHNTEYSGELVEKEVDRIKSYANNLFIMMSNKKNKEKKKKSLFKRIFRI